MAKQKKTIKAFELMEMDDETLMKTDIIYEGKQDPLCCIARREGGWAINDVYYLRDDIITIMQP